MKSIKWDTLKENIGAMIYSSIAELRDEKAVCQILADAAMSDYEALKQIRHKEGELNRTFPLIREYAERARKIVMMWDVRCAGQLRDLFPMHFPKHMRTGQLIADYDAKGDWVIMKKEDFSVDTP